MTQTASGAMDPREVEVLRSGFIKIAYSAIHGVVLIVDMSLLPQSAFNQAQPQVHFYLATILSCEVTMLYLVRSGRRPKMIIHNHFKDLLQSTLLRIKDVVIVQAYEEGSQHLLDYLGFEQRRTAEINLNMGGLENNYIVGQSEVELQRLLDNRGFDKSCLPPQVGGTVDMSTFNDWVNMRLSLEDITSAVPMTGNLAMGVAESLLSSGSQDRAPADADNAQQLASTYPALVQRPGESDRDFQKRKNASYVRRNYHRQRLSALVLEGEAEKCRKLNVILTAENQRLQQLLAQATDLVSNLDKKPAAASTPHSEEAAQTLHHPEEEDTEDDASSFASILLEATDEDIEAVEGQENEEDTKA